MELQQSIKKLANQCVKCGVCAPHCPTYVKTQHEGESARGRIALMDAVASNKLPLSKTLLSHLESCLYCRSCEAVCPSNVAYGELFNTTHQLIGPQGFFAKLVNFLFKTPRRLRTIAFLLKLYQKSGLARLLHKTGLLRLLGLSRYDTYLPPIKLLRWHPYYSSPTAQADQTVNLFMGCITSLAETHAIQCAIQLITAWGFNVNLLPAQGCCGAFHLHSGSSDFPHLAQRNIQQFGSQHPTLFLTSGCGMILKDYPSALTHHKTTLSPTAIKHFSQAVTDIFAFLSQHTPPTNISFQALPLKVAVQIPCSMKNSLKTERALLSLLKQVPSMDIVLLQGETRCCGAAGLSMLTHPDMADKLANDLIEKIKEINPDIILTSNIGCRLHLEAQLRLKNIKATVLHPLELLAQQLMMASPANK